MNAKLLTVADVAAYVVERPFIPNQIAVLIQDGKAPIDIITWLRAGIRAAGDTVNPIALLHWLERTFPQAWPPCLPATEFTEI
jgi:hypothetical protein